jgi:hypothetical protein
MSRLYDNALHMMEEQGGSFVKALVNCYYRADSENKLILRIAFAHYFQDYERRFADHAALLSTGTQQAGV